MIHYWNRNGHFNSCMASSSEPKTMDKEKVTCEKCKEILNESN